MVIIPAIMLKDRISRVAAVDNEVESVVVCNSCCAVIAEDHGSPMDVPVVATRVRSHLSVPNIFLLGRKDHEILTVDMKKKTSVAGLSFEKEFTD